MFTYILLLKIWESAALKQVFKTWNYKTISNSFYVYVCFFRMSEGQSLLLTRQHCLLSCLFFLIHDSWLSVIIYHNHVWGLSEISFNQLLVYRLKYAKTPVLSCKILVWALNKLKCWTKIPASSALLQWCPESRGEPGGTPEEDRQRSPAAQGSSDAGAGGGVISACGATFAMDFYGFHIPLLVVSGFCNTALCSRSTFTTEKKKKKTRISLGCHCVFWYTWHYIRKG